MSMWSQALEWLVDGAHWQGSGGIPTRIGEHLLITLVAVTLAAALALPLGLVVGHARKGAGTVGAVIGAARAVPTLGVLTLCGLWLGIGLEAPVLALTVLAAPSLLAGAYAGVQAIPAEVAAAARAIGMSHAQVITKVELPLALPLIIGGLRSAALQVVATATLAAYTADAGLGRYLFAGLKTRDYPQMLAGAMLVIVLAVLVEVALAWVQRRSMRVANPARRAQFVS